MRNIGFEFPMIYCSAVYFCSSFGAIKQMRTQRLSIDKWSVVLFLFFVFFKCFFYVFFLFGFISGLVESVDAILREISRVIYFASIFHYMCPPSKVTEMYH